MKPLNSLKDVNFLYMTCNHISKYSPSIATIVKKYLSARNSDTAFQCGVFGLRAFRSSCDRHRIVFEQLRLFVELVYEGRNVL